ncbi:MAG: hypothetical protein PUF72_06245 [Clostridiales bacterium]|nr:hypothetical protein [Clostridiales bacterium]
MKLLIAGSRSIQKFDISPYIPNDTTLIITGGAAGVDTLAEQYADLNRISKLILRPEYKLYRRGAPLKRNNKMVEIADSILIFWDGLSRGTKHTIDYAKKLGKDINIIIV